MSHHKLYVNMVLMAEEKGCLSKVPQRQLVSFSSCVNFKCISVRSTCQMHKHLPF